MKYEFYDGKIQKRLKGDYEASVLIQLMQEVVSLADGSPLPEKYKEYKIDVCGGTGVEAKEVLLVLTDDWADWEASFAIAEINSVPEYTVKTAAIDNLSKVSIGGMRVEIDYNIKDYQHFDNLAMVILTGGYSWTKNQYDEIAAFIKKAVEFHVPVAAICGATIFLGKHGFLDKVKHTGDDLEYFQSQQGYNGQACYVSAQIAVDKGFITANETASVDFASEIFKTLKIHTDEEINLWRDKFKNGMVR